MIGIQLNMHKYYFFTNFLKYLSSSAASFLLNAPPAPRIAPASPEQLAMLNKNALHSLATNLI